jgi:hypothetical protein
MASTAPPAAAAAVVDSNAGVSMTVYDEPLDDPELYPSFDEIMVALQDVGTKVTKGKAAGEIRYTLLIKAVTKTQKTLLAKYKHLGFPKNPTECKREIANHCIRIRKLKDVINLPTEFHNYKNADGQVFVINTELVDGGYRVAMAALLSHWGTKQKESIDQRNPNDALRLAAILLDEKHRAAVQKIMTNLKSDRKQQDQAACPAQAFFSVASADFTSPSYVAKSPALADQIEGHEQMDPNDVSPYWCFMDLCYHLLVWVSKNNLSTLVLLYTTITGGTYEFVRQGRLVDGTDLGKIPTSQVPRCTQEVVVGDWWGRRKFAFFSEILRQREVAVLGLFARRRKCLSFVLQRRPKCSRPAR